MYIAAYALVVIILHNVFCALWSKEQEVCDKNEIAL
jgi:hypothetical protein